VGGIHESEFERLAIMKNIKFGVQRELRSMGEHALAKKLITSKTKKIGKYTFEQSEEAFSGESVIYCDNDKVIFLGYKEDMGCEVNMLQLEDNGEYEEIKTVKMKVRDGGVSIKTIYNAVKKLDRKVPYEGVLFCLLDKPLKI